MNCKACNKAFSPKHKLAKYCSSHCKVAWNNTNRVIQPNVKYNCVICGEYVETYISPSAVASGKYRLKYCSRKCKGKGQLAEYHWNWQGGKITEADGYVMIHLPDHPLANNKGYVFEHRLVMEKHLCRYLRREEIVHHKNGSRSDNRLENLELYANNAEHKRHEMKHTTRDRKGRILKVNHHA